MFLQLNDSLVFEGNHNCDGIWISELNKDKYLRLKFSTFSLVSIERIHQTLKTVFDKISKHLKVRKIHSAARQIFSFFFFLKIWLNTVFRALYITTDKIANNSRSSSSFKITTVTQINHQKVATIKRSQQPLKANSVE